MSTERFRRRGRRCSNRLFDLPDVSATPGPAMGSSGQPHAATRRPRRRALHGRAALGLSTPADRRDPRGATITLGAVVDHRRDAQAGLRKLRVTITTPSGKQRSSSPNPAVVFNDLMAWRKSHGDPARRPGRARRRRCVGMIVLVILLFVAAFMLVLFDVRRGGEAQANAGSAAAHRRRDACHAATRPRASQARKQALTCVSSSPSVATRCWSEGSSRMRMPKKPMFAGPSRALAPLAADNELVITHGNGPQVGLLALAERQGPLAQPALPVRRARSGDPGPDRLLAAAGAAERAARQPGRLLHHADPRVRRRPRIREPDEVRRPGVRRGGGQAPGGRTGLDGQARRRERGGASSPRPHRIAWSRRR